MALLGRLHHLIDKKIQTLKIRTHGDYHLGQVLYTGKDFVIIAFEGEPSRSITERRLKQSALRDVAAMVRSFHYAAQESLLRRAEKQSLDLDYLRHLGGPVVLLRQWHLLAVVSPDRGRGSPNAIYRVWEPGHPVVPTDPADFATLLEIFILEKAVYELGL